MSWLVTGAGGMLGQDVVAAARSAGHDVTAAARLDLDVTDPDACLAEVSSHDVVVNTAAWTAVDDAESHEPDAFAINAIGAGNLARACERAGARLVQVSTDYVFAGDATSPYAEDAPLAPRSAYGRTKAAGEWAVRALCPDSLVVRTAWLYGEHGGNFVKTMARLAGDHDTLDVVDDQEGQPTWTVDVADAILRLVEAEAPPGAYHATSSGSTTWFEFTRAIFTGLGLDPDRVRPTTTAAFPRPAPRPAYSVLGHDAWQRVGRAPVRDWRDALTEALPRVVPT
ncbi:dTDP-4-dehydrorhamnose reductase [Segeticoccus rhizosphaerae]|uniref:dTDP-4-dehydrorhamnose reductase n=1 Tax=Segeticoccus rhizosphaerae TaxID=1104777 RepID=UPI0010C0D55A|nr:MULTISPECIES: dTDP-4-dehydrorhamnose reductase [Intrasporangiaceae]